MGILRKASAETKTILLDETDSITVRADISKREFNALVAHMPNKADGSGMTIVETTEFTAQLFDVLVLGWTLSEGKPTITDYEDLSAEAATAIDSALAEHFESLLPSSAEGK